MSENQEVDAVETVAEPATAVSKPVKKKAAAKSNKEVKPAKKTPKKTVKAPAKKKAVKKAPAVARGDSIRLRVFKLLAKNVDGLTGRQIKDRLELSGVPNLLKDEGLADKPRIRRRDLEGVRGVVYQLTAAGKADLEKGKVDENAPTSAAGKEWPDGK